MIEPPQFAPLAMTLRQRRGAAIIIVLAFVVLLTGIVVAMLTLSLSNLKISENNAEQIKADLFAKGATDQILGDLKQEIVDGSSSTIITTGAVKAVIYTPKSAGAGAISTVMPADQGLTRTYNSTTKVENDGLNNLIKRSAFLVPFYDKTSNSNFTTSGRSRAANVASTTSSNNGRSVSLVRWNKPLLLAKKNLSSTNDTDLTPVANYIPPDWILMGRDGTNPTAVVATSSAANYVIGRYAYNVYDEGGVLDANVAGYPSSSTAAQKSSKVGLSYADLSGIFFLAGFSQSRADQIADQIVAWRNYATLQPTGTFASPSFDSGAAGNYFTSVLYNLKGFLSVSNATLFNNQSDRMFSSRQELQKFLLQGVATNATERSQMQNALWYLGTFTRDLNQPSFVPDSTRPLAGPPANGGNNANGLDDLINPSFLTVRVTTAKTAGRNDGSDMVVGEPLVKRRFALNRLAWLTYEGPSAGASAVTKSALLNAGVSQAMIDLGTAANVYKYFGLSWVTDSRPAPLGDGQSKWVYNHSGNAALTTIPASGAAILRVGRPPSVSTPDPTKYVQDLATPREPDFFELLKAGVAVGSLGKSSYTSDPDPSGVTDPAGHWQYQRDIDVDAQLMQIAANIIDQADVDGFPTRIIYNNGAGGLEFRGVENLPYLYRVRYGYFKVRMSVPDTSFWYSSIVIAGGGFYVATSGKSYDDQKGSTGAKDTMVDAPNSIGTGAATPHLNPPMLTDTGLVYQMAIPDVWNPHDQNASRGASDSAGNPLYPTSFRVVAQTSPPGGTPTKFTTTTGGGPIGNLSVSNNKLDTSVPFKLYSDGSNGWGVHSRAVKTSNSGLYFTINKTANGLFREPTALFKVGLPAGSGLSGKDPTGNGEDNALIKPDKPGNDDGNLDGYASGASATDGVLADPNMASGFGYNPNKEPVANGKYMFFYLGAIPMASKVSANANHLPNPPADTLGSQRDWVTTRQFTSSPPPLTYSMQCLVNGKWATYDEKFTNYGTGNMFNQWVQDGSSFPYAAMPGGALHNSNLYRHWSDPRTSRLGALTSQAPPNNFSNGYPACLAPGSVTAPIAWTPGVSSGVLDQANWVVTSDRPDFEGGRIGGWPGTVNYYAIAGGWYSNSGNFQPELFSQNRSDVFSDGRAFSTDGAAPPSPLRSQYYTDADGVLRRAMGAYASPTAARPSANPPLGVPQATGGTISAGVSTPNSQSQSRPFVLNRPFRSVTELGYTFMGTPWKNIDFFTPESGQSALLDVFCINDSDSPNAVVAGKVNLNSRQADVFQAVLVGGYKDETATFSPAPSGYTALAALTATDAKNIASALVQRTTPGGTTLSGTQSSALKNIAGLVGQWTTNTKLPGSASNGSQTGAVSPNNIDGNASYEGLSKDLNAVTFSANNPETTIIQRFRESALRPLTGAGQARVWNLMIDLVAQTGKYPSNSSPLANFVVEGEQRYWIHVAIDRYTGLVVDKQIEIVKE